MPEVPTIGGMRIEKVTQNLERANEKIDALISSVKARQNPGAHGRLALKRDQTLYLDLEEDMEAVVTIQIKNAVHGTSAQRRPPTVEELHRITELLARRVYQFHPNPTVTE